jgi:hypothetical protein
VRLLRSSAYCSVLQWAMCNAPRRGAAAGGRRGPGAAAGGRRGPGAAAAAAAAARSRMRTLRRCGLWLWMERRAPFQPAGDVRDIGYRPARTGREAPPRAKRALRKVFEILMCRLACFLIVLVLCSLPLSFAAARSSERASRSKG